MAFTLNEALSKIGTAGYTGVDGLIRLVQETSAKAGQAAADATLLLYSGQVDANIYAWQAAVAASNDSIGADGLKRVVTIGDTAVSKLLDDETFKSALFIATNESKAEMTRILEGKDISGNRINNNSLWDIASRNFVGTATGEILTMTPEPPATGVFAQTEIDAALNSNATHINGVPREDLVKLKADLLATGPATQADIDAANKIVMDSINVTSSDYVSTMTIAVDIDGNVMIDSKSYFNAAGLSEIGTALDDGISGHSPAAWIAAQQTHEKLTNAQLANEHLIGYAQEQHAMAIAEGNPAQIAKAAHYLNKLGIIGDVVGLALVASDANAAYAEGDTAKAQQLLSDWAIDYAGGLAGGIAASELVSSALAPLYLTGPAGTVIAGGLSLIAGIVGGIGGGNLAQQLADYFNSAQPLPSANPPSQPESNTGKIIQGDLAYQDFDPATDGIQTHTDSLGNIITIAGSAKEQTDLLFGSEQADLIQSGALADQVFGRGGNDLIEGGSGADTLDGGAGDDLIYANMKTDFDTIFNSDTVPTGETGDNLSGGEGDDLLVGSAGDDTLAGGMGLDLMAAGAGADTLYGDDNRLDSPGNADVIFAGGGADKVWAGAGDDHVVGDSGQDMLYGESGDDIIQGGSETDILVGGAGDDILFADSQNDFANAFNGSNNPAAGDTRDWLAGGAGNDQLIGSTGGDVLSGGSGNDLLAGGAGNDYLLGDDDWVATDVNWTVTVNGRGHVFSPAFQVATPDAGADAIYAGAGDDIVWAGGGNDNVFGGSGRDQLLGEQGNDNLLGDDGDDTLYGDQGEDNLYGGAGVDLLFGGENNDQLYGNDGDDELQGGDGDDQLDGGNDNDLLIGDAGNDRLLGQQGDDQLQGRAGNDYLEGGAGDDTLWGDDNNNASGNDELIGGTGDDRLLGGFGDDRYLFAAGDGAQDIIEDRQGDNSVVIDAPQATLGASLASDPDGNVYLALQYGEADTVYVKNGLQGAVQNYIINGQAYHYSELLAQSYDQAIDFQITEPDLGPLYASRFDDTLKGSDRADVIYGQGGDDLLAGGAGNDRLIGGDGQDTYVLGIGSGADTVIENGTDINTISLHQGLAISDLATEKRGNDLFLHLRGTEDGMILKDYYSALPEWKIQTADGTMSALANLNLPESTLLAASLPEIMDNYMTRVEAFYGGALKVNGFVRKPDGLYHKTITTESFYSTTKTTDHYQLGIEVDSQTVNGNLTADRYNITNKNEGVQNSVSINPLYVN